jgi:hypothetical protein
MDFLEHLPQAEGQKPSDFGITNGRSVADEVSGIWTDAKVYWEAFKRRLERATTSESPTTITREQWVIPLMEALGYNPQYQRKAHVVDGKTFPISHRADEREDSPPVHIVACDQELGTRPTRGRGVMSPHTLLQEYLNHTEHLWGIVTNGYTLRLLRDSSYLTRQAYVEFDLKGMLEGDRFNEFIVLYRLVHRTRFPRGMDDATECLLEHYHAQAREQGGRIREGLRDAVEESFKILANGFLQHPDNKKLREQCAEGELPSLEFYRELLRLIYRLLFLMVAEERGLLTDNPVYHQYYSVTRLRRLAERPQASSEKHCDLYYGLVTLFHLLRSEKFSASLGMEPLNGELFDGLPHLEDQKLSNAHLLKAINRLSYFTPKEEKVRRWINYAALDVEELGSIYESLLDLQPMMVLEAGRPVFVFAQGTERKSTGSYYTPPALVQELVKSALEPVVKERLDKASSKEEEERALLSMKVCDPACGSGHFLLAAARRLAKELARVRTDSEEPSPEAQREAMREVIRCCLFGVDKNPLAVDLCKVALWIEGHNKGLPLTFLDHHIKCGDSLVGVFDLDVLKNGIPDEAYKPVEGDEKEIAKSLKKQNKKEREMLLRSLSLENVPDLEAMAKDFSAFATLEERKAEDVRTKSEIYQQIHGPETDWWHLWMACNLWTAAFFMPISQDKAALIPTTDTVKTYLRNPKAVNPKVVALAWEAAEKYRFFHWPLEFPEAFAQGGFDVVLGNPPWEKIKLQEKEFFATRHQEIARAPNAAARKRLIKQLPQSNPNLWQEYLEAKHYAEALSRFLRASGRFPLTARGDINTYSVFAELFAKLLNPGGRAGVLVPTGIATDDTNKHFFAGLVKGQKLVSLFDFENREGVFPGVHRSYKFSLLTLRGSPTSFSEPMDFLFFATRTQHLKDPWRRFTLTAEDFERINPNTLTCPIFRTRQDADLTREIYQRVPVLINEGTNENPWGISFLRMFDMSNDSHLFHTREQLAAEGYKLVGNRFVKGQDVWLPLYEAKMIWHYDHRFGTYEGVTGRSSTHLPTPDEHHHADPDFLTLPWYWVPAEEVEARLVGWKQGWLLGFRDVTNATNERTAIFSLLPRVGVGNNAPLLLAFEQGAVVGASLLSNLCSIAFDWVVRQKIAGTHMNFFYVQQFPVLPPSAYTLEDLLFIVPRVLELTYTAWDIKPFAKDVWRELVVGSGEWGRQIRKRILEQWEDCHGIRVGEFLSRPGRMEGSDGAGRNVLWPHKGFSEGGALRIDEPDPPGSGVGAGEHRGRVWAGEAWGIHSILEDLSRFAQRSGDPSFAFCSGEPDHCRKGGTGSSAVRQGGANSAGPDSFLAALITTPDSPLPPFRWNEERRAILRAELDAYYTCLYGLTRKQLRYILDPTDLTERELKDILDPWEEVSDPLDPEGYQKRCQASTFPGETFRVLKEKELRQFGEYRTRRLVLEAWGRLEKCQD